VPNCTVVFLGSQGPSAQFRAVKILHRPYERDVARVADYYRAADVYLHPARADTFPTAVLESLACGIPVVSTDVGGIPEQVSTIWPTANAAASPGDVATGILVSPEDLHGPGRAIELLLKDRDLRRRLGENGARSATSQFTIGLQVERYLSWYREILDR
jgi:glycosyltransferase involved in cell wall biosynthesis